MSLPAGVGRDVGDLSGVPRARQGQRLPTELTVTQRKAVLDGAKRLVCVRSDNGYDEEV